MPDGAEGIGLASMSVFVVKPVGVLYFRQRFNQQTTPVILYDERRCCLHIAIHFELFKIRSATWGVSHTVGFGRKMRGGIGSLAGLTSHIWLLRD